MRIVFIDTETTDVPERNPNAEIIAYSVQAWCDGVRGELRTIHLYPTGPVNPEAQRVNGYTSALWASRGAVRAFDWHDLAILREALDNAIVGGHNTGFDTDMISREFARRNTKLPEWNYRKVDTQAMAMGIMAIGAIQKASLESVAAHFGIINQAPHTSYGDVTCTIDVFEAMIGKIYMPAYGL